MAASRVYVTRVLTPHVMQQLSQTDWQLVVGEQDPPTREQLLMDVVGTDAVITTLTERIDSEVFDAAGPQLRIVANVAAGYDNIDVEEATRRGIVVTNTPGVLDKATADHSFAMLLAVTRRVVEADQFARSGAPWQWGPAMMVGLDISAGATLGIVGYGQIGKAMARRALAFGMRVLATSHSLEPGLTDEGVEIVSLPKLLAESDVVSLHVPLTPETRHLIDAAAIAKMKPGSYLINSARGGVVDEQAMIAALAADNWLERP